MQVIAQYVVEHLPHNEVPALAKRHKVEVKKGSASSVHQLLLKQVGTYDDSEICKLLLEVALLDSAYQRSTRGDDVLMGAAKRYRVDAEKLQKAVAEEFGAKLDRRRQRPDERKNTTV